MTIKRPLLVLFSIFVSTHLHGNSAPVADETPVKKAETIRLSMLNETRSSPQPESLESSNQNDLEQIGDHGGESGHDVSAADYFSERELAKLRRQFQKAEKAVKNKQYEKYARLADQLTEYPLYPYLEYQWLKKNLHQESKVKEFLEQHPSSRYAGFLKRKWLFRLASKKRWQTFLEFYDNTGNTRLNCYYHMAQYQTGDKQTALLGAKKLWAVGYSQPKACDPLFAELMKSSHFNQALFWHRFDASLQNNKTSLANYVKKLMPAAEQKTAQFWLRLHRDPEQHLPKLIAEPDVAQAPSMFTHAITRLARRDIYQAADLWDRNKDRFDITAKQADKVEKDLGLKLAFRDEPDAYEWLGRLKEYDYVSNTWRVRVALSEQDWPRVLKAIKGLSDADQKREKWQYWLARAYEETGKPIQAEELLSELASKRDFYGYMAAERLNRQYQLSDNPIDVTAEQMASVENHKEFRVAYEFKMLGRESEAKLQWWHAVRQLKDEEVPAAAKLAKQWQWDEIAIFTIAKIKYWDDIELRFPLSYSEKIQQNALQQDLNPAIIFGLIRRESAFNKDARSPVGARGLMQIMPRTGRQIAKDLNESWQGKNSLYNPVKNLRYGSYYYQKLLNQFNGHYALALAAYNAGPHRVKKWLPDDSIPADIWIETIPFRETRDYVTTVLVYAMIYQQLMQSDGLTMADFTRAVRPLTSVALN